MHTSSSNNLYSTFLSTFVFNTNDFSIVKVNMSKNLRKINYTSINSHILNSKSSCFDIALHAEVVCHGLYYNVSIFNMFVQKYLKSNFVV